MSQLNNDNESNKDKLKKNRAEDINKEKQEKKIHPIRNTVIFLIVFTLVCIGITAALILKDSKERKYK